MENKNTYRMPTPQAAGISLFISVILFIVIMFAAQIMLPAYFFETSNYYLLVILMELVPLGIGAWFYLLFTGQQLRDIVAFSRPQAEANKKNMPWLIILGAAMAFVGRIFLGELQLLWVGLLERVGYAVAETQFPPVNSIPVFFAALAGIAVTPAIFEELLFRGILQKGLLRNTKPKTAIIISSLMFMFMHLSVESMVFTFACGLLLGFMAYKSGSIIPSMAFHFVNNMLAVVSLYALELAENLNIDQSAYSANETLSLIIYGAVSFALLAVIVWGFNKLAKSPPKNPYIKPMNPATIIFIVLSGCILFFVLALFAVLQNVILI